MDLTSECYCTCHLGPKKLDSIAVKQGHTETTAAHFDDVARRIRCTWESALVDATGQTCITCDRIGTARYKEMTMMEGVNLEYAKQFGLNPQGVLSRRQVQIRRKPSGG